MEYRAPVIALLEKEQAATEAYEDLGVAIERIMLEAILLLSSYLLTEFVGLAPHRALADLFLVTSGLTKVGAATVAFLAVNRLASAAYWHGKFILSR